MWIDRDKGMLSEYKRQIMQPRITLDDVAADALIDQAFAWVCKQRRDWPDSSDIWPLRWSWSDEKRRLRDELASERFRFGVQDRVRNRNGEYLDLWSARDAIVLKALTLALQNHLGISRCCVHVKGHGGAKAAVRAVMKRLPAARFVVRTDVRDYYASIDHVRLLDRLATRIADRAVLNLVGQMCSRVSERAGLFYERRRGIPRGCPLSPLIGAFFLSELDQRLEATGLFLVRYMDDILVLAATRHKLRRAVTIIKTFIGRVEKGVDFLGYHLRPQGLSVAPATLARFAGRAHRLYEQERGKPEGFPRLGAYVRRWRSWSRGGLPVLGCPADALQIA